MKTIKAVARIALVVLSLSVIAATAGAQTTENVNYTWTAPTSGSAVEYYVVQHSVNGGPFVTVGTATSTGYTLVASVGDSHQIRVAGVDIDDRQGVYSEASDAYTPQLGAPGAPGKPIAMF